MKTLSVIFLSLLFPVYVFAQIPLKLENPVYGDLPGIYASEAYDFDNDGDTDLIVAGRAAALETASIGWFENSDGKGTFSGLRPLFKGKEEVRYMKLADLDGDDLEDLVFGIQDEGIYFFRNLNGGFSSEPLPIYTEFLGDIDFEIADLDEDGDLDLAADSHSNVGLVWLENMGGQQWEVHTLPNGNPLAVGMTIGDFNGDQKSDILTTHQSFNGIFIHYQTGSVDGFSNPEILISDAPDPSQIETGDFNGDGLTDLALVSDEGSFSTEIFAYISIDGLGNFENKETINSNIDYFRNMSVLDSDSDGKSEIFYQEDDFLRLSLQLTPNVFSTGTLTDILYSLAVYSMTLGDFNGDNQDDLVISGNSFQKITAFWFPKNGNQFGELTPLSDRRTAIRAKTIDFDKDGYPEIVEKERSSNDLYLVNRIPDNVREVRSTLLAKNIRDFFTGDFNNDGWEDLFYGFTDSLGLMLFDPATHQLNFNPQIIHFPDRPFAFEDMDLDGFGDCLAHNSGGDLIVRKGISGSFSFESGIIIDPNVNTSGTPQIWDLNGDNKPDIVRRVSGGGSFWHWYPNLGNLEFDEKLQLTDNQSGGGINFADLDMDGDLDMLSNNPVNNWATNNILFYENLAGDGILAPPIPLSAVPLTQSYTISGILAFDIDLDGDNDIFTAPILAPPPKKFIFLENLGGLNFADPVALEGADISLYALNLTDWDNDRDLDIIGHSSDGFPVWFRSLAKEPSILAHAFFDENENSIKDGKEPGLKDIGISINDGELTGLTAANGDIRFYLNEENYKLTHGNTNWNLTTDSSEFQINLSDKKFQQRSFGFAPDTFFTSANAHIGIELLRCNRKTPVYLTVVNTGTTTFSGYAVFEPDDLNPVVNTLPQADSVSGNHFFWFFEDLTPTQSITFQAVVQAPGADFINVELKQNLKIFEITPSGDENLLTENQNCRLLRCSYDPNDKLVQPNRGEPENYTLFEEPLTYMIRFQNTGNDTAFQVRITDQLNPNLDWESLRIITASHSPLDVYLDENGLLIFDFKEIILPDSTTNFEASNGFVQFSIEPKEGLSENTIIENSAEIFFDLNPPILTNTTSNTFVSELPGVNSVADFVTDNIEITIAPNPFDEQTYVTLSKPIQNGFLKLHSSDGKLVKTEYFSGSEMHLKRGKLNEGLYLISIHKESGIKLGSGQIIIAK